MCVRSIPVRHGGRGVRSCAFAPFPCAHVVAGFVRVRSVDSRLPWGSSGSLMCLSSVPVYPSSRRVRSCAFAPIPCATGWSASFSCVQFIPVRPWVCSGTFAPLSCALEIVRYVRAIPV